MDQNRNSSTHGFLGISTYGVPLQTADSGGPPLPTPQQRHPAARPPGGWRPARPPGSRGCSPTGPDKMGESWGCQQLSCELGKKHQEHVTYKGKRHLSTYLCSCLIYFLMNETCQNEPRVILIQPVVLHCLSWRASDGISKEPRQRGLAARLEVGKNWILKYYCLILYSLLYSVYEWYYQYQNIRPKTLVFFFVDSPLSYPFFCKFPPDFL